VLWPGIAIVVLIAVVAFIVLTRSNRQPGTLTIGPTAEPAREATAPSANPSDFVPTPDDASAWVMASPTTLSANTVLRMRFDGTITDRIALPAVAQPQAGVGASVFVWTPGGINAVSGDGTRRITSSGLLTAVSADHLARLDCAADLTCQIVIGTHDDPDQVRVPIAATDLPAGLFGFTLGRFSPDGRRLALPLFRVQGSRRRRKGPS
jgi:hypothetical protein